jgi:hypothetical protein
VHRIPHAQMKPHPHHSFDPHQETYLNPYYRNHNWNCIKIITAKPGQKQNITTNHIKIIKTWKSSILETSDVIRMVGMRGI